MMVLHHWEHSPGNSPDVHSYKSSYHHSATAELSQLIHLLSHSTVSVMESSSNSLYYDDKFGHLQCHMNDCMIIASFGDELPSGVRVAKRQRPGGEFLPGVREDLDKIQDLIDRDKSKVLRYVYTDYPGVEVQRSKTEYLNNIENFLKKSQANAGTALFCLL